MALLRAPKDAFGRLVFFLCELVSYLSENLVVVREQLVSRSDNADVWKTSKHIKTILQVLG
jgi:hypothetical protein